MVDKLRKAAEMLWLNKERLVLVVMVCILCFQVYKVLYPEKKAAGELPMRPQSGAPEVPQPTAGPGPTIGGDYLSLSRRNPFSYYSGRKQGGDSTSEQEVVLKLINIQEQSAGPRARIQTATTTQWYNEGDSFEQFKLISIDVAGQTATVYVESLGREMTITIE
jgi:hypothetical protein